jgi:hypothetical protein
MWKYVCMSKLLCVSTAWRYRWLSIEVCWAVESVRGEYKKWERRKVRKSYIRWTVFQSLLHPSSLRARPAAPHYICHFVCLLASSFARFSVTISRYAKLHYTMCVCCTSELHQTQHQTILSCPVPPYPVLFYPISKSRLLRLLLIPVPAPALSCALTADPMLSILLDSFPLKRVMVFPLSHV